MTTKHLVPAILTASALGLGAAFLAVAGPLTPAAGPVASTYKTLTDVEPRIAINAANTPGDGTCVFRITQPGSYYLTGNLTGAPGRVGIIIASNDVTLDLNGYSLRGNSVGSTGITTDSPRSNITVRNGVVTNWIFSGISIQTAPGIGFRGEDLTVSSNGQRGLETSEHSQLVRCFVSNNSGYGIAVGQNSIVTDCVARGNTTYGILAGSGALIRNCEARSNNGEGIVVFTGSTVLNCVATANTLVGIDASSGCLVQGCTATGNTTDGIFINAGCTAIGNVCDGNGAGAGVGAGIHVLGIRSRIEGNNLTNNDRGLDVDGPGNIAVRNTASGNSVANWDIAGNNFGIYINGASHVGFVGASGGASMGSTDPNANFSY